MTTIAQDLQKCMVIKKETELRYSDIECKQKTILKRNNAET